MKLREIFGSNQPTPADADPGEEKAYIDIDAMRLLDGSKESFGEILVELSERQAHRRGGDAVINVGDVEEVLGRLQKLFSETRLVGGDYSELRDCVNQWIANELADAKTS